MYVGMELQESWDFIEMVHPPSIYDFVGGETIKGLQKN